MSSKIHSCVVNFIGGICLCGMFVSCMTTTYRNGQPVQSPPDSPLASRALGKGFAQADAKAPQNTNVRVELIPKKDNPDQYEYKITEVFPKTVYSNLGFRSGDLVVSVDGKPVQTMADAVALPERIIRKNFSKMIVRRNGKNYVLQAQN